MKNTTVSKEKIMAWEAGIWQQGEGFVVLSRHKTETLAKKSAKKYAKERKCVTGGSLSWSGGVLSPIDGKVVWYQADGRTWVDSHT